MKISEPMLFEQSQPFPDAVDVPDSHRCVEVVFINDDGAITIEKNGRSHSHFRRISLSTDRALPLWLTLFFMRVGSSAKVLPMGGYRKIGS